ncbi:putative ribonuclease H-like domain-containing protein [Tanacetum coccineum]
MTKINKKQYAADVRVMNYLLQAIPNDIYNLVDTSKEGESQESVYERLTTLVNIMDRNNVRPILVSINTKFLNCLQPEWSKYVTLASKAKRAARNHDPLALIAHSNAYSQSLRVPRTDSNLGKENVQCYNCNEKGHYARDCQKPRVRDAKYFREQKLLAMKDEAGSNLNAKENDFMLDNSFRDETLEELTSVVIIMARIQPADGNAVTEPTYDAKAVSEVNDSHKAHEQINHVKRKTFIHPFDDDQIDSNIIFNDPYVENNGGTSEHDSNDHDEYHNIQILAYNVQREAENQKRLNNELKKQKELLQKELETCKERVKTFESKIVQCSKYKETCQELKREIRADKDTIERILKEKDKIENGLVYQNPKRLKKAIAAQPKIYHGEMLYSTKLKIDSPDSEETLEDAEESVESSNSIRRPKSNNTKLKNRFLKNTNDKSSSTHDRKMSSSDSIDSNKHETINLNVCQSNASVLNTKIVNVVNDGSNIVYVSYGKDVFMLSHEKYVACYALSRDSRVKRALFTTLVAAKSKNLGATSIVAKSGLSIAKTPTATNKVSSALSC